MDNIAGPPVEGDNFYGRASEIDTLWQELQQHDILLLGPRRIGKTSVARAVIQQAARAGWSCFEVNVAACSSERDFVQKLVSAVDERARSAAGKVWVALRGGAEALLGRVKGIQVPGGAGVELGSAAEEPWSDVASDTLRTLINTGSPWLIYMDELPIFLFALIREDPQHGIHRVRRFLDWFRNDVRGLPQAKALRWIVTGSVGLDTLVQRHRMADTINSLKHTTLAPFSDAEARGLLDKLSRAYAMPFSEADCTRLIQAIRWPQPYYLQVAFNHLRQIRAQVTAAGGEPMADSIDRAVQQMVQPGQDNDFHHWEARLKVQLDAADAAHAIALLKLASVKAEGALADDLYNLLAARLPGLDADQIEHRYIELRDVLQRDAYWMQHDGADGQRRYRFQLEPLRLWWRRRYAR